METINEFLNRKDIQQYLKQDVGKYVQYSFTRDPVRTVIYNPEVLYSPADGFILYSKVVSPTEPIVEVKGLTYSLRELLRIKNYSYDSLVVGIYMSAVDVHYNRVPIDGWLEHYHLPPIKGYNTSMRYIEQQIFKNRKIQLEDATYLVNNERVVNKLTSPYYDLPIYIVQIADSEVDKILHFSNESEYYLQGDKFSLVISGSQVDIVVPISSKYYIDSLVNDKIHYHVEAGIDVLFTLKPLSNIHSKALELRSATIMELGR